MSPLTIAPLDVRNAKAASFYTHTHTRLQFSFLDGEEKGSARTRPRGTGREGAEEIYPSTPQVTPPPYNLSLNTRQLSGCIWGNVKQQATSKTPTCCWAIGTQILERYNIWPTGAVATISLDVTTALLRKKVLKQLKPGRERPVPKSVPGSAEGTCSNTWPVAKHSALLPRNRHYPAATTYSKARCSGSLTGSRDAKDAQ